jgi:GAF domain-containing protein
MAADGATAGRHARNSVGLRSEAGLTRDLSDLTRDLQGETSTESLLRRIVESAVAEVEPACHAGISEIIGAQVRTRVATDPLVERVDEAQYTAGDGPCLTSLREEQTVRVGDLLHDGRWPGFAERAVDMNVRSMLSVQLFVEGDNLGALNLYAEDPDVFDESHEGIAMLIAAQGAVAMKRNRTEEQLKSALLTRDVIGQAKGILMERYKIDQAQAFDLLVLASQRTHRKLHDIAAELSATGELRAAQ